MISFLAPAKRAAQCAHDKKADNIQLLDIRRFSSVSDYCLLATVDSPALMRALEDHIDAELEKHYALRPVHRDGRGAAQWLAIDYGGLVVHLMHPHARMFYALERLWENAKDVKWEAKASRKPFRKHLVKKRKILI